MLRRVAPLVPVVLIGRVPALAALSVRPTAHRAILVRTPVLCTSYESKPIKYQVIIAPTVKNHQLGSPLDTYHNTTGLKHE